MYFYHMSDEVHRFETDLRLWFDGFLSFRVPGSTVALVLPACGDAP